MSNKHAKWLAPVAALMLVATAACQNHSNPAGSAAPSPAPVTAPAPENGAQGNPPAASTSTPGQTPGAPSGGAQPVSVSPAAPAAAATTPSTTPKPAEKLYKMNPKTYDIVPIDPASTEKKVVLLTFDDGPRNNDVLESILNTLDKHNAKAIFFVNGYLVKQKPELLKLIQEHGQTIGNHSWDHIDLKKESKEKMEKQVGDVQSIVKEVTGSAPQFFRPPFGSGSDELRDKVKQENMLYMTWSNGSLDWEMSSKKNDPDKIVANVLGQLRPGSNILMHELAWTDKALDKLLTQLKEKEYGFVDPSSIQINP